jgi:hypothetical protein
MARDYFRDAAANITFQSGLKLSLCPAAIAPS